MRKLSSLLFVLTCLFITFQSGQAQGPSGISYPPETEVVRGVVEILGTADNAEFWKYELAAAPFGTQNWFNIAVSESAVRNGVLGRWNTNTVNDGTYTLRLRVVRRDGNYDEFTTQRVLVGNALPTNTPTPEVSPTSTITPTTQPPTATPVVITPDLPTPTSFPTDTPTPEALVIGPDEGTGGTTDDVLDTVGTTIRSGFWRGARVVLIVFIAVGFFFAVKQILSWMYYRFIVDRTLR